MGVKKRMYFSNISNVELQQFHNFKMKNFNISLTEMLNSNLFKVETIINDTLYRVFPLFYTDNVKSSNSDDKILDNRCIIAIKKDKETYYSFINNEEDGTIVIYDSSFDFKTIGDQLTDEEFNSIVQLYRSKSFTDNIQIINSLVNGAYADYLFNLESTTIVDNGVLITKETLDNIGTVRLLNPVFKNSEYILHLKVFTVEDFNIDMSDTDNIIVTDLTVPLSVNQEVNIPFETLDLNNIVGFDATVSIAHNQNIIQYPSSLTVSSSTDSPVINKDFELSCVYLDETGEPVNNELITFKSGETVLGTSRTNSDGLAVLEYSASSLGNLVVYCIDNYSNKSNTISVNVVKQTSSVTLETDKSLVYIPGEFTVNGALLVEGEPYHGNVILLNNGTVLDTLEANRYGLFSKTINVTNASNFNLQAKFEDTASISGANSSYVNVVARRLNTNLTIQTNRSTVYFVSQNVTISGVLTDELGNAMSGANVTLNGESSSVTATTNSSGAYSFTKSHSEVVSYTYNVSYAGDGTHNSKTSGSKTVNYRKAPVNISIVNPQSEYKGGDTVLIRVSSDYGTYSASTLEILIMGYEPSSINVTEKDSNGNFIWTAPSYLNGEYPIMFTVYEDDYYLCEGVTINMTFVNRQVDTLTVSRSGTTFTINCKKNGANVTGLSLEGGMIHLSNPEMGIQLSSEFVTNSSGNVTINLLFISGFHGTLYLTFAGVTSNTIKY